MTQLELKIESRDGVVLMAFSGELDLAEAARVEQRLLEIEAARPPLVVLDLRGLTFIDSSGLRLVIEADQRARRDDRRMALVRGPEQVRRIFAIALLDTRLQMVEDPAELSAAGDVAPP